MVIDKVRETIEKYNMINENEHVVLGLSGGPDSVCLFFALRKLGYHVHAVHVNHMMRRETAKRDENFVRGLCYSEGCECHVFTVDCNAKAKELGVSGEEAGRMARYESFKRVTKQLESEGTKACIAVAHNADDQAETVLFRIMRGTGVDGLAAMEPVRFEGGYRVVRPLLSVTRREIEEYLASTGIEYMTDETNLEPIYTRNKLRLELIPHLQKEFNENITDSLCRLAGLASVDKDYLWQQTEEAYKRCLVSAKPWDDAERDSSEKVCDASQRALYREVTLYQDRVAKLHPAIRNRVFLKCLRMVGLWQDVTNERLEAASELLDSDSSTKVLEFPHGYRMTFAFGKIKIKSAGNQEIAGAQVAEELLHPMNIDVNVMAASSVSRDELNASGVLYFDAEKLASACNIPVDELSDKVQVRSREAGDYILLNGGKKLLKKLMGEMKIPADERDLVTIVAVGRCVLYIEASGGTPRRYAESFKVIEDTAQIITVKFV